MTAAEDAATVRDHLAKPRADWLEAATALDALLAKAEAAEEETDKAYDQGFENGIAENRTNRKHAEDARDAAVRAAERYADALEQIKGEAGASWIADIARAALTGEGTSRVLMDASDQQAIADAGLPVRCCDNWPECSHVAAALTGDTSPREDRDLEREPDDGFGAAREEGADTR